MAESRVCDVLVIGGGPAGATVSTLLARHGHDVILLDKRGQPRPASGETLLPAALPLLDELGVRDQVTAISVPSRRLAWHRPGLDPASHGRTGHPGTEHGGTEHGGSGSILYGDGRDQALDTALQVRRPDLDEILLSRATDAGVTLIRACTVREVEMLPARGGARVGAHRDPGGRLTFQARFLIDASGRDTVLAHKLRTRLAAKGPGLTTLQAVFEGLAPATAAAANPGDDTADEASITMLGEGWLWVRPLVDGQTSIGVVVPTDPAPARGATGLGHTHHTNHAEATTDIGDIGDVGDTGDSSDTMRPMDPRGLGDRHDHPTRSAEARFEATLRQSPALMVRLAGARRVGEVLVSESGAGAKGEAARGGGSARRSHGDNHLLVGDAFNVADPAFSSGLLLALRSGFDAAQAINTLLRDPTQYDATLARFDRQVRRGPREFAWFIRHASQPALWDLLIAPPQALGMRAAVLGLLAGDVHGGPLSLPSRLAFKALYSLRRLAHLRPRPGTGRRAAPTLEPRTAPDEDPRPSGSGV